MKIQINSLEALERLIGGDSQVEFEIRQSVVSAFTKKHLKQLVSDDIFYKASKAIIADVEGNFVELIKGKAYWKDDSYVLTEKAKSLINQHVQDKVDSTISNLVYEQLAKSELVKKINNTFTTQAEFIANELSNMVLTNKLNELVDKKIKEKLNLS